MTGESGAGKTSLLSLLYLHLEPTKGRVRLLGQAMDTMSRSTKAQIRRQIGVVFQDYHLLNHLNAFVFLSMCLNIFLSLCQNTLFVFMSNPKYAFMSKE